MVIKVPQTITMETLRARRTQWDVNLGHYTLSTSIASLSLLASLANSSVQLWPH